MNASEPTAGDRVRSAVAYEHLLDCVHCGLCTSACPTYLETGAEMDSPRGRIYLMRQVTDGTMDLSKDVARHLELCLDCRACETACPSGVQYGRLIEPFRVAMQREGITGKPAAPVAGWLLRFLLFALFPYPNRLRWALLPARLMQRTGLDRLFERLGLFKLLPGVLQQMQAMLPPPPKRAAHGELAKEPGIGKAEDNASSVHQRVGRFLRKLAVSGTGADVGPSDGRAPGGQSLAARRESQADSLTYRGVPPRRATVALLTGCVADAVFPQVHEATIRVLQENGCDVLVPKNQGCCGAIHYHAGEEKPAIEFARRNAQAFADDAIDAVIVNVAGCGAMMKEYGHLHLDGDPDRELILKLAAKTRDVSEFLVGLGIKPPNHALPARVAYHDACHLCHAQQIRSQPRALLKAIPGVEVVHIPESEICCGAAGTYNLTEPEMANRLAARKVANLKATNAHVLASPNAGCTLHLGRKLREESLAMVCIHPVELLDKAYRGQPLDD